MCHKHLSPYLTVLQIVPLKCGLIQDKPHIILTGTTVGTTQAGLSLHLALQTGLLDVLWQFMPTIFFLGPPQKISCLTHFGQWHFWAWKSKWKTICLDIGESTSLIFALVFGIATLGISGDSRGPQAHSDIWLDFIYLTICVKHLVQVGPTRVT